MAKNYICVFDCESIVDADLVRKIYGFEGDDAQVSQMAMEEQVSRTNSAFLPVVFHRIVAISAVVADEYGKFMRVSTMEGRDEREILTKFIDFLNKNNPRLVSFNGRGFDLPAIMVRAMRYNLSAPAYYEVENRELNKSKWDNYRYRNSDRFHIDLLDQISDFKAVGGLKLDTLCASMNLPGKYDVCGDQVMSLYYDGRLDKINEYCESDVLNTYWLFLKFELLRANIGINDYANNISAMGEFLRSQKPNMGYTSVFCTYVDAELARLRGELDYDLVIDGEFGAEDFEFSREKSEFTSDFTPPAQRVDPKNLGDHLAQNGLDGLLQKGASNLKSKRQENAPKESLPEINLDDE